MAKKEGLPWENGDKFEAEDLNRIEDKATESKNNSEEAISKANSAVEIANNATDTANEALIKSENAEESAVKAHESASSANDQFLDFKQRLIDTESSAQAAVVAAENAERVANQAAETGGSQVKINNNFQSEIYFISDPQEQINEKANLESPMLTGIPTAPTASISANNNQIATTEFVKAQGYITSIPSAVVGATSGTAIKGAVKLVLSGDVLEIITD